MVVTRSSKQKGNNDGIPGQKGLSVGLQKLLFSEIERTGGIETYYNEQGQKKQKLQDLLDSNAVRPYFPSEIEQEQAKSCVKYWRTLKKQVNTTSFTLNFGNHYQHLLQQVDRKYLFMHSNFNRIRIHNFHLIISWISFCRTSFNSPLPIRKTADDASILSPTESVTLTSIVSSPPPNKVYTPQVLNTNSHIESFQGIPINSSSSSWLTQANKMSSNGLFKHQKMTLNVKEGHNNDGVFYYTTENEVQVDKGKKRLTTVSSMYL